MDRIEVAVEHALVWDWRMKRTFDVGVATPSAISV
jgi:hypothetical protein